VRARSSPRPGGEDHQLVQAAAQPGSSLAGPPSIVIPPMLEPRASGAASPQKPGQRVAGPGSRIDVACLHAGLTTVVHSFPCPPHGEGAQPEVRVSQGADQAQSLLREGTVACASRL
jgi:hypothetical protein